MAARFETVVAVRVPSTVERELRRRARADDRPLSSFLRRELTKMATEAPAAQSSSDRGDGNSDGHV